MLPLAKAAVLTVLLGGGTVGAYALTGGFGSGSGNGNTETAQEGMAESNALPSQPVPADTPQIAPRGPEVNGTAGVRVPEGAEADTTDLNVQGQKTQKDSGVASSGPRPAEGERTQDTPVVQNTVSGENPGNNEVSSVSDQTPKGDGVTQNASGGVTVNNEETAKTSKDKAGEEAEVTLGEEKSWSPSGEGGDSHSA